MRIGKFLKNIYVKNLLAAILVIVVLVLAVLSWLKIYTQHGQSVEIPDVKGLLVEKAEPIFASRDLNYQVIDSVFSRGAKPGSIVESVPPIGSKVKRGRTIYLKINSYTAQLISIPNVKDLSQRQAFAMLKSIGFESVSIKSIPGKYRDLAVGLESRGVELEPGDKVTINTPLALLVSSGSGEITSIEDSTVIEENNPDETWF
ncbi:MAG: PASTA domain-containing protein [Candidatus Symbiothrix sp.]|jgi:beta-lactam-binding protein with PASTA domain|nr:PASTA domain-containing protein [Candidatus Symbiothrix sp.]